MPRATGLSIRDGPRNHSRVPRRVTLVRCRHRSCDGPAPPHSRNHHRLRAFVRILIVDSGLARVLLSAEGMIRMVAWPAGGTPGPSIRTPDHTRSLEVP